MLDAALQEDTCFRHVERALLNAAEVEAHSVSIHKKDATYWKEVVKATSESCVLSKKLALRGWTAFIDNDIPMEQHDVAYKKC